MPWGQKAEKDGGEEFIWVGWIVILKRVQSRLHEEGGTEQRLEVRETDGPVSQKALG